MKCSPPSPTNRAEPLAGGDVIATALPVRGDLSDWVELMEAVEALCPVWPMPAPRVGWDYRM